MFNWFGRKGAPDTVSCAYAPPPWLAGAHEEGFAQSIEGMCATDKSSGQVASFVGGSWEIGHVRASKLSVDGDQVVGVRLTAVTNPVGGTTVDTEARAAIANILARLRTHGLIDP